MTDPTDKPDDILAGVEGTGWLWPDGDVSKHRKGVHSASYELRDCVRLLPEPAVRAAIREYIQEKLNHYPTDVFPNPEPGEHGQSVDACSARAIRQILQLLMEDFPNG